MFGIYRIYDVVGNVLGIDAGSPDRIWAEWVPRGCARIVFLGGPSTAT